MWRKRIMVAAVIGGLLVLSVIVVGGSYLLSAVSDCSGQERAIVEEYPHHGDRRIATYPWTFPRGVRYTTDASRKEVLDYYDEILRREGWQVMGFQTASGREHVSGERLSDLCRLPRSAGGTLVARRDGYSYWVSYEPPNAEDPDLPDDEALVMVWRTTIRRPQAALKGSGCHRGRKGGSWRPRFSSGWAGWRQF